MTNLIILTGAPATGKSKIAEWCAEKLKIPTFSKDAYKIQLFEKYGYSNHAEKKALSIMGEKMLIDRVRECVINGTDVIIDNNFKNFSDFRAALTGYESRCNIICVFLYADSSVLASRYNERIESGQREISLYVLNQYPVIDGVTEYHQPLDAGQVDNINKNVTEETYGHHILHVDTTPLEFTPEQIYCTILNFIREKLK